MIAGGNPVKQTVPGFCLLPQGSKDYPPCHMHHTPDKKPGRNGWEIFPAARFAANVPARIGGFYCPKEKPNKRLYQHITR